jgi:tetraacyldisaccharide 4'-kinase
VLSIGNITAGGTGKTPVVAYLASWYLKNGIRPVVLSRGYGRPATHALNDEGKLLQRLVPGLLQLQGPDRVALAVEAEALLAPDILLLDDGFQHRRLHRDLDVVLIDATNPFGYGAALPRGLLREPPTALRRADLLLVSRGELVQPEERHQLREQLRRLSQGKPIVEVAFEPVGLVDTSGHSFPLRAFYHRRVAAFCGIGNPSGFFALLRSAGLQLLVDYTFPDHHHYDDHTTTWLRRWAIESGADLLVTTEKDLVKLPSWPEGYPRLLALRIQVRVTRGRQLFHALLRRLIEPQLRRVEPRQAA